MPKPPPHPCDLCKLDTVIWCWGVVPVVNVSGGPRASLVSNTLGNTTLNTLRGPTQIIQSSCHCVPHPPPHRHQPTNTRPYYGHHTPASIYTATAYQLVAPNSTVTFCALDGARVQKEA